MCDIDRFCVEVTTTYKLSKLYVSKVQYVYSVFKNVLDN